MENISDLKNKNLSADELFVEFEKILKQKDLELLEWKKKFDDLNVIIDIIPNTISWINSDLTYFGVNRALAKTCGLNPEDFVGKAIGFHTKENFFLEFATDLFMTSQKTLYRELEANISGKENVFLVSGTKINNNTQAVVIGVDITELKNLKGHISLTEKLATLGEMFAGIIHDINNPLMMIEAGTRKIRKKSTDTEIIDIINKIEMSTNKVSKIIQGVKNFIREDSAIPFEVENLGLIIDDAVIICENKLKSENINLKYDPQVGMIEIKCNFTQLFQVFVNLISNAVDAIAKLDERWINIYLAKMDNEFYYIHFQDSGNGIPQELQDKIFQAFYTTKGRGVGSGLGLSLCTKIIEEHKGSIKILNSEKHTTFEIKLPRHHDK